MMKYKGYIGKVTYDPELKVLHGDVIGIKDVITFEGTTEDIEQAFMDSVDDYLEWCQKLGQRPDKTFSGKLHLRITPELHADLAQEAAKSGISLNSLICEKLKN